MMQRVNTIEVHHHAIHCSISLILKSNETPNTTPSELLMRFAQCILLLFGNSRFSHLLGLSSWWRHQMETCSALLALCEGNPSVLGGFQSQRQVTRSFDVFFDLRMNKRLSKQSIRWWFETRSRPLRYRCNALAKGQSHYYPMQLKQPWRLW